MRTSWFTRVTVALQLAAAALVLTYDASATLALLLAAFVTLLLEDVTRLRRRVGRLEWTLDDRTDDDDDDENDDENDDERMNDDDRGNDEDRGA